MASNLSSFCGCLLLATSFCGCRMDRMTIHEPVGDRVIEVESGDRFFVELEERQAAGYVWEASCNDDRDSVDVTIRHLQNAAEVAIRVHRGFVGPSTVEMVQIKSLDRLDIVRRVRFVLWKRDGDVAPWCD